ncbi:MAG TPA: type IX secretion system protein PorQ [Chitinophagaceae bacterium]|nr:type IX secretion system protein PorQ [Chitinophagaceae bacterium]
MINLPISNAYFRRALRYPFTIFLILLCKGLLAQTLGGSSVFNFLKLSNTPQLTALGGVNISQPSNDVGLAFNNPALLKPEMHTQMNAVFNDFYGGIKVYHLSLGYHNTKLNTNFSGGINYFNYGNVAETDAAGNVLGKIRPTDWVMQVSASRSYLEKWNYGTTLKFISSNYGQYRSNGIAIDMGVLYLDSAKMFSASVVAKNMGFQLKKYNGSSADDLPFDLQIGITKKLEHAPFSFSITVQRIHQFNIRYNDTAFNNENGFPNGSAKNFSFDKLISHFILASTIYLGHRVEVQAGYNFLRRKELNISNGSNGLNGFSIGVGAKFGKLQIRYARTYYQTNSALNQLGINMQLNQYFGLQKFGQRIGW